MTFLVTILCIIYVKRYFLKNEPEFSRSSQIQIPRKLPNDLFDELYLFRLPGLVIRL
jgi:hypothetical protein